MMIFCSPGSGHSWKASTTSSRSDWSPSLMSRNSSFWFPACPISTSKICEPTPSIISIRPIQCRWVVQRPQSFPLLITLFYFRFNGSGEHCEASTKQNVPNSCNSLPERQRSHCKASAHWKAWTERRNSKFIVMIARLIVCRQPTHGKLSKAIFNPKQFLMFISTFSFNQLDLPVYKSYDKLRTNLLKAIHECSEGFGFA